MGIDTKVPEGVSRSPSLSVIIPTKDRAHELETISLPSLARQDTRDFEVIVWDASKDDRSERVVRRFAAEHPDIRVRYFRAPRVGLPAQRNDAARASCGEVLFYVDDDSEISPGGISLLVSAFAAEPELSGGCLPLRWGRGEAGDHSTAEEKPSILQKAFGRLLTQWMARIFFSTPSYQALTNTPTWADPGPVDRLIGCDMAIRKSILLESPFNEKMQRFAPYAHLDEIEVSHRIWRKGHKFRVLSREYVVHHPAPGDRYPATYLNYKVDIFNGYELWRTCYYNWNKLTIIPFAWAALGQLCWLVMVYMRAPAQRMQLLRGLLEGYWAVLQDFFLEGGWLGKGI